MKYLKPTMEDLNAIRTSGQCFPGSGDTTTPACYGGLGDTSCVGGASAGDLCTNGDLANSCATGTGGF
jgi:hypothetical protein